MRETALAADANWVIHIKQELQNLGSDSDASMREKPFLTRVPAPLHVVRPSAFTPQTLAIGPLHRNLVKEGLYAFSFAEMEEYKLLAAKLLLSAQSSSEDAARLIDKLVQEILKEEEEVRACFGKEMGLSGLGSEELGYMLGLDCIFIVALMHSLYNELHAGDADDEKIWWVPSSFSRVYERHLAHPVKKAALLDLLLLENQVPLFLVKKVMQMMDRRYGDDDVEASFQELVDAVAYMALPFCKGVKGLGGRHAKHLLDCLYTIVTHPSQDYHPTFIKSADQRSHITDPLLQDHGQLLLPGLVPTATQLRQAGVQFKGHPLSLSHVSFERHTLTLPNIHVGDETERIFRNLLAHESQLLGRAEVASYLHFMNSLINTADDVAVLVEAGVISENIGDYKHVARLWNQLATNTACIFTPGYSDVASLAKAYVEAEIHGVMAELRERYFSRPWLVLSLLSGTALLLMTFIIMWYTIELYIKG